MAPRSLPVATFRAPVANRGHTGATGVAAGADSGAGQRAGQRVDPGRADRPGGRGPTIWPLLRRGAFRSPTISDPSRFARARASGSTAEPGASPRPRRFPAAIPCGSYSASTATTITTPPDPPVTTNLNPYAGASGAPDLVHQVAVGRPRRPGHGPLTWTSPAAVRARSLGLETTRRGATVGPGQSAHAVIGGHRCSYDLPSDT